jgi:hypothetical protein
MPTSRTTSRLSKPEGRKRVPESTLVYVRARNRMRAFTAVLKEFDASGISQSELAARLGKSTSRVCKWLGAPGNWELDTISDLVFALTGGAITFTVALPQNSETTKSWPKRKDREIETDTNASYLADMSQVKKAA